MYRFFNALNNVLMYYIVHWIETEASTSNWLKVVYTNIYRCEKWHSFCNEKQNQGRQSYVDVR